MNLYSVQMQWIEERKYVFRQRSFLLRYLHDYCTSTKDPSCVPAAPVNTKSNAEVSNAGLAAF